MPRSRRTTYHRLPANGAQPPPPGKQNEVDRVEKRLADLTRRSTPASTRATRPSRPTQSRHKQDEVKNSDNKTLDELMAKRKQEEAYDSLFHDESSTYQSFQNASTVLKGAQRETLEHISALVAGTKLFEHEWLSSKQGAGELEFYRRILKTERKNNLNLSEAVDRHIADPSSERLTIDNRNDLNQYIRSIMASVVKDYQYTADDEAESRGKTLWEKLRDEYDPPTASTSQVSSSGCSSPVASTSKDIHAQCVFVQPSYGGNAFMKVASSHYPQDTNHA